MSYTANLDPHCLSILQEYKDKGFKIKVYDYPSLEASDGKRHLRDFEIEDLLYRSTVDVIDEKRNW